MYAPNIFEKMLVDHIMKNITFVEAEIDYLLQFVEDFEENTPRYENILDDATMVSLTEKINFEVDRRSIRRNGPTEKLRCHTFEWLHSCINL